MRSFLVRKINNFTKTLSLRAKLPNTYGARLYVSYVKLEIKIEQTYDGEDRWEAYKKTIKIKYLKTRKSKNNECERETGLINT